MIIDKRLIIAGTARDCAKHLPNILENIKMIASMFKETRCLFTESDSSDNTVEVLRSFNAVVPTEVYPLGNLSQRIPFRVGRISYGRNFYLKILEERYSDFDVVLFLDLDEVNSEPLSPEAVLSCFNTQVEWDMVCANHGDKYYDLWALRHPIWMPFDCWEMFHHKPRFMTNEDAYNFFIRSRFIHIDENLPFIQVLSAFGGAAFVKIASIQGARHNPINKRGEETVDWVSFCETIKGGKGLIYINPKFIIQRTRSVHVR